MNALWNAEVKSEKQAIIAIARIILTAVFNTLSTGKVWKPTDLYKFDMPEMLMEKQKFKAIKQAIKLLKSEGIISEELVSS